MIARMKKITLISSAKTQDKFLLKLRRAGAVHIKHVCPPSSNEITFTEERLSLLNDAADILPAPDKTKKASMNLSEEEAVKYAEELLIRYREKEHLQNTIHEIQNQIDWYRPWGSFNPHDVKDLKNKGIFIKLYSLQKSEFKKIRREYSERITIINKDNARVYLALILYKKDEKLPFDEAISPEKGLTQLQTELNHSEKRLKEIDTYFKEKAPLKEAFKKEISDIKERLEFLNVRFGMKSGEVFSYLQGFIPESYLNNVISMAKLEGAGYLIEEPDDPDETPTLVKNPKWIRIIDPVFKFMNTLPGYAEYDISVPFLLFFSLFFAMLIGDAGYGILFMIITFFAKRKFKNAPQEPFYLVYALAIATTIWGVITGTYFGFEKIAQLPILNNLIIGKISSFAKGNQDFMIYLCFIIGAVHLSIAHIMMALRVINSRLALGQLGWIMVVWGLFYTAGTLVLAKAFPSFAGYLILGGAILIMFFSSLNKNILKGALATLGNLPLSIISAFSDVVSYLRLFAVGYASVIVANSFNNMAMEAGFGSIASGLGAAFILFFGHALNIALGIIAVVVHGIRLNMLEFSGHLGMQWSGREYKPFKE